MGGVIGLSLTQERCCLIALHHRGMALSLLLAHPQSLSQRYLRRVGIPLFSLGQHESLLNHHQQE